MIKFNKQRRPLRYETLERRELLTTFYVDGANGSNSNDGLSLGSAFETIQAGASAAFAGDNVLIRGGTYREKVVVPRSGNAANPIVFQAYNNEDVIISGADLVTGWTQHSGDIWVANANWNAGNNRENNTLFVDGVLQQQARQHAENDYFDITDWGVLRNGRLVNNASSFIVDDLGAFPDDYWNGAKIRFHTHDWIVTTKTITDFDSSSGRISFSPSVGIVSQKHDNGYYIYDTLKAVDKAGEWFKQDGGNQLYYQVSPGQNPNSLEIELKNRDFAFNVRGRDYIHIKGIELRGATIDTDSNTDYNLYEGNHFYAYDVNNYGRFFVTGDYNVLRDNEFSHTWGAIASVGGLRNEFVNNYIHHIGYSPTARVILATGAEELLFSHNTVSTFARSFMDGYPTRSEIAFNVFENGGNLSWDTGVFDSDGGNGNSSYSIFHHNIFRDTDTRGIFEGFYGLNSNAVVHHNLIYNFDGAGRTVFRSSGREFRQAHHNTFITSSSGAPSGNLDAIESIQARYNNNLQITLEDMEALGVDVRGNYNYSPSDFMNFGGDNFQLDAGSGAIDSGIVLPGINDNYVGAAPDAGAFEFGQTPWTAGHNFVTEPNPVYSWTALPGTNNYGNGQFLNGIGDWTIVSGDPVSQDRNSWNLGASGASLTGTFRTQSIEFTPGESIQRTFTGLTPNTTYTLGTGVRIVDKITIANQHDGSSGSISFGTHRDEQYITGLDSGEWVRYDDIDFGDPGQFDQLDLLHIRNPQNNFLLPIDGISVQVRLDSPTGPLLTEFPELTVGSSFDRWRADRADFGTVSGVRSIYVSTSGTNGGNIALGSMRLLKKELPPGDLLDVNVTSTGAETIASKVGANDWHQGYEEVIFTTGPSATHATVQFENNGRLNAYLDKLYLIEGHSTRGDEPFDVTVGATAELSLSPTTSGSAAGVLDSNLNNLTQTGDHANSWIQVELGEIKDLHAIKLSPSSSQLDQLSNFRVSVWSDDPRSGGIEQWNQDFLTDGQSLEPDESLFIHSNTLGRDGLTELRDVSGRFVRVQLLGQNNNGDNQLALGEIQVLGFGENNWALSDGIATQSTTSGGLVASNANDGDMATRSATSTSDTNSWWQVRFAQGFGIGEIELVNHDDSTFAELSNFTVSVWDEDPGAGGVKIWEKSYFSTGSVGQGESFVVDGGEIGADGMTRLASVHRGRVIQVQLNGTNNAGNGRLSLADVRVTATHNAVPIQNLAQAGLASQSSNLYGDSGSTYGFAVQANDGIISPVTNFTSTPSESGSWWQVDLQRATQIDQIVLFNRTDAADRLNNFTVSVWDDDPDGGGTKLWGKTYFYSGSAPFYSTSNIGPGGALLLNGSVTDGGQRLDSHSAARFVRVQLNGSNILSLAEVQVWSNNTLAGENVTVNLASSQYDYDLGSSLSPVGSGYTAITPIITGDIHWSAPVNVRDAGTTGGVSAVNQDLIYSSTQRTLHHNIANGVWEVTVSMGDVDGSHDNMRVFAEGKILNETNAGDVDSSDGQFVDVVGVVQVTDGVLDLTFDHLGGIDGEWVLNRLSLNKIGDENYILLDTEQTTYDYDLGTASSPLASGYARMSNLSHGDVTWSNAVQANNRVGGGAVNQDFVSGSQAAILEHPLTDGIWDVTVNLGDADLARDDMFVSAEGITQLSSIDTAAGEFVEHTFRVEISDGGLSLQMSDGGGSNPEWVFNRLSLVRVSGIPAVPGDFNVDQKVDDADLIQWRNAYGTGSTADADLDRDSDGFDFLAWQRGFGVGVATVTTLVDSTVGNGSFEDHAGSNGLAVDESLQRAYSIVGTPAAIPNWTLLSTFGLGGWEGVQGDPNASSDGTSYALADDTADVILTSDIISSHVTVEGDVFTLRFDTGSNNGAPHTYKARLKFGENTYVLGSVNDTNAVSGNPSESLLTRTFEYIATASDAGFSPVIEIFIDNNGGISRSYLDNVVFTVSKIGAPSIAAVEPAIEQPIAQPAPQLQQFAAPAPTITVQDIEITSVALTGLQQLSLSSSAVEEEEVVITEDLMDEVFLSRSSQFPTEDLQLLADEQASSSEQHENESDGRDTAESRVDKYFESVFELL